MISYIGTDLIFFDRLEFFVDLREATLVTKFHRNCERQFSQVWRIQNFTHRDPFVSPAPNWVDQTEFHAIL